MKWFPFVLAALATELVLMGKCRKEPGPPVPVAKIVVLPSLPEETSSIGSTDLNLICRKDLPVWK